MAKGRRMVEEHEDGMISIVADYDITKETTIQVLLGFGVYRYVNWFAAINGQPESFQPTKFRRVVSEQANRANTEINQNLRSDAVLAAIDRETKFKIGVNRVES